MAKKPADPLKERNPLAAEEAAALAEMIADCDPRETARLLLLLHAFTYEHDRDARYHMFFTVEGRLGGNLKGFEDFIRAEMRPLLDTLREGGTS